ncbi:YtxH domain-containing protein [Cellulomonas fimi]|uniref:YtxH domain-containing protein n=1 Tax=Cellulomonas fimi TaxID=1708 RepID=UPI001B86B411|nr:YtxH domain-containing protein [Cellulomonas fimi]
MKSKAVFILGAGVGYVLGTRAGRQQFEKIKGWSRGVWEDPRVQAQVTGLEEKATEFAKTQAPVLKEKVTGTVKSAVGSVTGGSGSGSTTGRDNDSGSLTNEDVEASIGGADLPRSAGTSTDDDSPFASPPGSQTNAGGPA